jgi:hypothetical protein
MFQAFCFLGLKFPCTQSCAWCCGTLHKGAFPAQTLNSTEFPNPRPLHLRISADLQHDGSSEATHWQLSFCSPYPRWQYRHTSSSEYAAKRVNVCASPIPCPAYLGARVESFEDSKKRRQAIKTSFMNFDYSYSHDLFFLSATRQEHARA